ncbi:NUDIX hydrolase [Bacillus sp. SM2101]|uniref:NUDIX hydrolase n=1 Tax=Bacillus sp. SM2101 TaxID=2805366 RepID=UPI001BDE3627|nr:NUDIX hydrolase [Bacillus sp. SM2101]
MGYIMDLRKLVGNCPLIMVGASVILLDKSNRVLLQLRKDNRRWGLPGGSSEMGETLEEVARRELFEETGLTANSLKLFNVFSGEEFYYKYPNGDEVYNVVSVFICTSFDGVCKKDVSEVADLQFFHLNELPEKINPPDYPIIKEYLQKRSSL